MTASAASAASVRPAGLFRRSPLKALPALTELTALAAMMLPMFAAAAEPAACFYEHANYGGQSWCVEGGGGPPPSGRNDQVSSLKVAPGYTVRLFEHIGEGGRWIDVTGDEPNLVRLGFNDLMSSYRVGANGRPSAATPVCLYEHVDYQGGYLCLPAGTANVPAAWNDRASSLRVLPGHEVTLFADIQSQGRSQRLTADTSNLVALNFNDIVSSTRVQTATPPCTSNCTAQGDVLAVRATGVNGQAPVKGEPLRLTFTLRNSGAAGTLTLRPSLTSTRFSDFNAVPLGTISASLAAGETRDVSLDAGPFLDDVGRGKVYALGRGGYRVEAVEIGNGADTSRDSSFTGRDFSVGASNVVLSAVIYDEAYFQRIGVRQSPEAYMTEVVTRAGQVFTPGSSPNVGTYQSFPGGFDQMLNIRHRFRAIPGFRTSDSAGGLCEQAAAYGRAALGLTRDWTTGGQVRTNVDNHGFDYLNSLSSQLGGGVACGWLGVQVSGLFSFDLSLNRSQIVAVHEIGHLFGAPHCDPLQSYVMCAGELHERYRQNGMFVWHKVSRDVLANRFD